MNSDQIIDAQAKTALRNAFVKSTPTKRVDQIGYLEEIDGNLLPGVERRHFYDELNRGAGEELKDKFRATYSSSALVVNSLARFKDDRASLRLLENFGFRDLCFERPCPTGLRGTPPHLDAVAEADHCVIAIESKCTEYLIRKTASFRPAYQTEIQGDRRKGPWFRLMLDRDLKRFRHVDVAQLIKHAFGIANCYSQRRVILLYAFWEPLDHDNFPLFKQHRREIEELKDAVLGGIPEFHAASWLEIWDEWQKLNPPLWLRTHLENLRARYAVSIGAEI